MLVMFIFYARRIGHALDAPEPSVRSHARFAIASDRIAEMKFTLRDLFWAMLVVAICCAWWNDHRDLAGYKRGWKRLRALGFDIEALEKANHMLDP